MMGSFLSGFLHFHKSNFQSISPFSIKRKIRPASPEVSESLMPIFLENLMLALIHGIVCVTKMG